MNSFESASEPDPLLEVWTPRGPTDLLGEDECWSLLRGAWFGRLAISHDDQPSIFPVNYIVQDGRVLFRTAGGAKLRELRANPLVAFEADAHEDRDAWSVALRGTAEVVTDEDVIVRADRAPLPDWVPTEVYVWVAITPTSITGRRIWFELHPDRLA